MLHVSTTSLETAAHDYRRGNLARIMTALVNEGAKVRDDGYVLRATDAWEPALLFDRLLEEGRGFYTDAAAQE